MIRARSAPLLPLPLLFALVATAPSLAAEPAPPLESPPTLAAALRAPGPVLVVDSGDDRPHALLADKIADDLGLLRGAPVARVGSDQLRRVHWRDAHVVLLVSDPTDPHLLAMARGLAISRDAEGWSVGGATLRGDDCAAAVVLPHPHHDARWVMVLVGDGPGALRRLDRHLRNDLAAPMMTVDGHGERLASLVWGEPGWRVAAGHPYRGAEVVERFEAWRAATDARVERWTASVEVTAGRELRVDVDVALRAGGDVPDGWLQLSPRAALEACGGDGVTSCSAHDARDGRLLLRLVGERPPTVARLVYTLPLEDRLDAWYLGPRRGHVMPEANWLPRVRGEADEAFAARAPCALTVAAGDGMAVWTPADDDPSADTAPMLVWGRYRIVGIDDGREAWLPEAAGDAEVERARALLDAVARRQRRGGDSPPRRVIHSDRVTPWYGDGTLLATAALWDAGAVDEVDGWLLDRTLAESWVRFDAPGPTPATVRGTVVPCDTPVTVRLWRLRGHWWSQLDEGAVAADGSFSLRGPLRGAVLVTAEAAGYRPAARRLEVGDPRDGIELAPARLAEVALVCLRCGPEGRAERFPMTWTDRGVAEVTLAMDRVHRDRGDFPYAFELAPGDPGRVLALDPARPADQFPSFLEPDELYASAVRFELDPRRLRFWIELPGALLAREGWIGPAPPGVEPARGGDQPPGVAPGSSSWETNAR